MIHEKIEEARKNKGMTLEQIAKELGISLPAYESIANGELPPSGDQIIQLAEILGVDPIPWLKEMKTAYNVIFQNSGEGSHGIQGIGNQYHGNSKIIETLLQSMQTRQDNTNQKLETLIAQMQLQQQEMLASIKELLSKR